MKRLLVKTVFKCFIFIFISTFCFVSFFSSRYILLFLLFIIFRLIIRIDRSVLFRFLLSWKTVCLFVCLFLSFLLSKTVRLFVRLFVCFVTESFSLLNIFRTNDPNKYRNPKWIPCFAESQKITMTMQNSVDDWSSVDVL